MIPKIVRLSAALLFLALPAIADAQAGYTTAGLDARPTAEASRREGPVTIDGNLDEAVWERARPITGFRQFEPAEGAPASVPTELRVLYDDQAIYIGARMTQPAGVVAPLARRDQLVDASGNNGSFNSLTTDKLIVSFDPYHNHLDNVLFEINPAGVRGDSFNGDSSWDPIWEAVAGTDAEGWTAEMKIPLSQLRVSPDSTQTWGLQVWRYIDELNERDMWSFWGQNTAGGPAFFGDLQGLRIGSQPRQLEVLPYLVTGSTLRNIDRSDPYQTSPELRLGLGGDLKYLLTSSLTLDATFNPDFGQVEVDPATINLSAFETYYDEKRPFFVAGSSAFRFGSSRCIFCTENVGLGAFYSRRIGRSPQLMGSLDDISTYFDAPANTSILGAAKVTGRTQSGYTIGVLNAVTSQEGARYLAGEASGESTQIVEPFTNYFVMRTNKELRGGRSTIGGIVTSTTRQTDDPLVRSELRSHAEAVGFDWYHSWKNRDYSWMGTTLFSNVAGSAEAIDRTMRSSAHYYQRPDRRVTGDGIFSTGYDLNATSLQGYGLYTRIGKDGGGALRWEAMTNIRSPGLELNDLAFLNRGDYMYFNGNVAGNWTTPTDWYRNVFTSIGGSTRYNFDRDRLGSTLQAFYAMEFHNYWNVRIFGIHETSAYDDQLTRGGPVVRRPGNTIGNVTVSTDARSPVVLDLQVQGGRGAEGGTRSLTLRPGMAIKPSANIFVQLSPSYAFSEDVAQYVTDVADETATSFYGNRYVFGFLKRKTLSLETRVNATFTPNLTLQLYLQPFIASGTYSAFREFAAPRAADKLVYGRDEGTIQYDEHAKKYVVDPDGAGAAQPFTFENPDFTRRSLRGTAVLRWEYRPGSTLFFVWTQDRSGSDPFDSFNGGAARSMLFDDPATNIFQIKATYWIG